MAGSFDRRRPVQGIGIARQRVSPARIRRAAHTILQRPAYQARARALAEEMAQAPGVEAIVEAVAR